MIISASRRTDIPAFYSTWFIQRLRAGFCTVPNPFNQRQITFVSLLPDDVDAIVFWTRNPRPLFAHLDELDARGFRYYFQYTLINNPRLIDPYSPPAAAAIKTFAELSQRVGPERVIWRYDPIVLSNLTDAAFHLENFAALAARLSGSTQRCVVSVMDWYRKIEGRMREVEQQGVTIAEEKDAAPPEFPALAAGIARIAAANGIEVVSCAEELDLHCYGIEHGKCIDDELIGRVLGVAVGAGKDPNQRSACGCVASRDIGMYDGCLFGCPYCYATSHFARARENYRRHDPSAPSLFTAGRTLTIDH